jgi:hypothetical protein
LPEYNGGTDGRRRSMSDQSPDDRTVDPEDRDAQPLDEQQDPETEEDTASGGAPQPPE